MSDVFLKASNSVKVGDLVKVKTNERTSPTNVASRYGYVEEIKLNHDTMLEIATVSFNDFQADIQLEDLDVKKQ